ncbi:MAG: hypothetical protein V7608_3180, partial [Hyphomicrobiales bacterium]
MGAVRLLPNLDCPAGDGGGPKPLADHAPRAQRPGR